MKLSCIFLATANLRWLLETSLPSLIKNTDYNKYPFEIIIIFNGFKEEYQKEIELLSKWPLFFSDPLWVAKGYNLGAKYAQGEYLAFFHDDSAIKSTYWLDVVFEEFKNSPELVAVSPEIAVQDCTPFDLKDLSFPRCVPLIIKKEDFIKFGKFDEYYFFGFEDIDFGYTLQQNNYKFKQISFDYEHYKGSSTAIILGSLHDFYKAFDFVSLNYINSKYFSNKYKLPFEMDITKEGIALVPDLEILNSNKKDFADLIKSFYLLRNNRPEDSLTILYTLEKKYKDNFFYKRIKEKLNF